MREKINQEVSVVMYYSARTRTANPHTILWQNREFRVKDIGYRHAVRDGQALHHIFELTVREVDLWMRLNFDTTNLHWTLEAISDGLAT